MGVPLMPFSGGGVTEVCVLFLLPSVRQGGALALGLCHYRKKLHQFKIMRVKMQNRFLVVFFRLPFFCSVFGGIQHPVGMLCMLAVQF